MTRGDIMEYQLWAGCGTGDFSSRFNFVNHFTAGLQSSTPVTAVLYGKSASWMQA